MMSQFSAHTFSDINTVEFDVAGYSRLKFGSNESAKKFGKEMAVKFFNEHREFLASNECLVIPSAYNMLEIAATLLARHFMQSLNVLLVRHNMEIVKWTTMHRTITYFTDYAHMTHDERKKMLAGDSFFINKDFIKNKALLFIDDVIITGTHEDKIKEFLQTNDIKNPVKFLYYCKYTGNNPDTEAKLNTCGVNDEHSYLHLINEPEHQIIVRTCKYLLNGTKEQLIHVLANAPKGFVASLHTACLMEEYHKVPRYRDNMGVIATYLSMVE